MGVSKNANKTAVCAKPYIIHKLTWWSSRFSVLLTTQFWSFTYHNYMCRPTYPIVLGISLLVWWYLSLITVVSWSAINEIAVATTTKALDSLTTHNQGNVCPGRQFVTCTCLASFGLTWILKLCCHNFWKLQCVRQAYWFVGKRSSLYLWTELFVQFCSPPCTNN